jgi:hypothetical protein
MSFFFSFTNSENRREEQVLPGRGSVVPVGRVRRWMCYKYCVHMYVNGK